MSKEIEYPDILIVDIDLEGPDGNAFAIMGIVKQCIRACVMEIPEGFEDKSLAQYQKWVWDQWQEDAMQRGSYYDLLTTVKEWFVWEQDISEYER